MFNGIFIHTARERNRDQMESKEPKNVQTGRRQGPGPFVARSRAVRINHTIGSMATGTLTGRRGVPSKRVWSKLGKFYVQRLVSVLTASLV